MKCPGCSKEFSFTFFTMDKCPSCEKTFWCPYCTCEFHEESNPQEVVMTNDINETEKGNFKLGHFPDCQRHDDEEFF